MSGVGGLGPKVSRDVVVSANFIVGNTLSAHFDVSCGVVPDGTFPADLVLGKTIFHEWAAHCTP
jgi:hypothetical protein